MSYIVTIIYKLLHLYYSITARICPNFNDNASKKTPKLRIENGLLWSKGTIRHGKTGSITSATVCRSIISQRLRRAFACKQLAVLFVALKITNYF